MLAALFVCAISQGRRPPRNKPTAIVSAALDSLKEHRFAAYLAFYADTLPAELSSAVDSDKHDNFESATLRAVLTLAAEAFDTYKIKKEENFGDSAVVWVQLHYTDSSMKIDNVGLPLKRTNSHWHLDWPIIFPSGN